MLAALALGMVASVTAGCAQAVPASHPSGLWVTAKDANKEYRKATSTLTLATDAKWPADPEPATGPDGSPQYYQVGAATNDAQFYWFCSWTTAAAAAHTPAFDDQAGAALKQVARLRLGGSGSDENTKQLLDAVRAAIAGHDNAAVSDFNQKNCEASA
ncbi:hypothetical protein ACLBWP_11020 [Microbacterium sp. M1A1_1b]